MILIIILSVIIKSLTIAELISEKRAYDLIAEEEEAEIANQKEKERREKEFHRERMELLKKQERQVETETRKALYERRN